jgi:aspartyl protease
LQGSLHARSAVIPLKQYFRDLKSAELQLGDRKLTFLVDTAGGRTLISEELARAIGCTPSGRDVAYRMTGEPVVFANCGSFVASASDFEVALGPVAVFDVNKLLPPELPKLDGVLALDAFRGHVLSIDWSGDRLLVQSGEEANRALTASGVPIRIATGENGAGTAALVPVTSTPQPLWFLLDSGNIRGTLVGRHVDEQHLLPHGAGEAVSIAVGARPAVSLVPVVDDINLDGVLGTAYLKLQTITIDLRRAP